MDLALKFDAEKLRLADEQTAIDSQRQELDVAATSAAASRREIETEQQRLADVAAQLDGDREEFRQSREQFEQQRLANEQRAAEFAARQIELDARQIQFDLREAALVEQTAEIQTLLIRHEQEMASARAQLDAERIEVRAAFDELQYDRREFLEQRPALEARVAAGLNRSERHAPKGRDRSRIP